MQKIVRNYYLMMSPFVVGYLIYAFKIHSTQPLIIFLVFGIDGDLKKPAVSRFFLCCYIQVFVLLVLLE